MYMCSYKVATALICLGFVNILGLYIKDSNEDDQLIKSKGDKFLDGEIETIQTKTERSKMIKSVGPQAKSNKRNVTMKKEVSQKTGGNLSRKFRLTWLDVREKPKIETIKTTTESYEVDSETETTARIKKPKTIMKSKESSLIRKRLKKTTQASSEVEKSYEVDSEGEKTAKKSKEKVFMLDAWYKENNSLEVYSDTELGLDTTTASKKLIKATKKPKGSMSFNLMKVTIIKPKPITTIKPKSTKKSIGFSLSSIMKTTSTTTQAPEESSTPKLDIESQTTSQTTIANLIATADSTTTKALEESTKLDSEALSEIITSSVITIITEIPSDETSPNIKGLSKNRKLNCKDSSSTSDGEENDVKDKANSKLCGLSRSLFSDTETGNSNEISYSKANGKAIDINPETSSVNITAIQAPEESSKVDLEPLPEIITTIKPKITIKPKGRNSNGKKLTTTQVPRPEMTTINVQATEESTQAPEKSFKVDSEPVTEASFDTTTESMPKITQITTKKAKVTKKSKGPSLKMTTKTTIILSTKESLITPELATEPDRTTNNTEIVMASTESMTSLILAPEESLKVDSETKTTIKTPTKKPQGTKKPKGRNLNAKQVTIKTTSTTQASKESSSLKLDIEPETKITEITESTTSQHPETTIKMKSKATKKPKGRNLNGKQVIIKTTSTTQASKESSSLKLDIEPETTTTENAQSTTSQHPETTIKMKSKSTKKSKGRNLNAKQVIIKTTSTTQASKESSSLKLDIESESTTAIKTLIEVSTTIQTLEESPEPVTEGPSESLTTTITTKNPKTTKKPKGPNLNVKKVTTTQVPKGKTSKKSKDPKPKCKDSNSTSNGEGIKDAKAESNSTGCGNAYSLAYNGLSRSISYASASGSGDAVAISDANSNKAKSNGKAINKNVTDVISKALSKAGENMGLPLTDSDYGPSQDPLYSLYFNNFS